MYMVGLEEWWKEGCSDKVYLIRIVLTVDDFSHLPLLLSSLQIISTSQILLSLYSTNHSNKKGIRNSKECSSNREEFNSNNEYNSDGSRG